MLEVHKSVGLDIDSAREREIRLFIDSPEHRVVVCPLKKGYKGRITGTVAGAPFDIDKVRYIQLVVK